MTIRPRPDGARIVVEGREIGAVEWAQDGSSVVLVHGELSAIKQFVEELAQLLDANFEVVWQEPSA